LRQIRIAARLGDILVGLLVIALLAAAAFGAWRLYQGLTTSCIRVRHGTDCLATEPFSYGFSMLMTAFGCLTALGSAGFITYLRINERPD